MDNIWCHDIPQNMHDAFNSQNNRIDINSQSLVRFSAPRLQNFQSHLSNHYWKTLNDLSTAANNITPFKGYKRKNLIGDDESNEEQPPNKQYATEEKIMAKFNNLKLVERDEENKPDELFYRFEVEDCNNNLNNLYSIKEDVEFNEYTDYVDIEEDEEKEMKFIVCDEVKEFLECEDIITKLYREEKLKNCKALVLWEPQMNILFPSENRPKYTKIEVLDKTDDYVVEEVINEDNDTKKDSGIQIVEIDSTLEELDEQENNCLMEM